jgi:CspA family cold shock protein
VAREENIMTTTGRIKSLLADRGFGFIQEEGTSEDIFFHNSAMAPGLFDQAKEGQNVEFDKSPDPRDSKRIRATNVRLLPVG